MISLGDNFNSELNYKMAECIREENDLLERRKNKSKCLQRNVMMRGKSKIPTESRQARSTSTTEGGVKLGLTIPLIPLQEKVRGQTQRQEVKGRVEVRLANENREIK